jgi:hypothetical protein
LKQVNSIKFCIYHQNLKWNHKSNPHSIIQGKIKESQYANDSDILVYEMNLTIGISNYFSAQAFHIVPPEFYALLDQVIPNVPEAMLFHFLIF